MSYEEKSDYCGGGDRGGRAAAQPLHPDRIAGRAARGGPPGLAESLPPGRGGDKPAAGAPAGAGTAKPPDIFEADFHDWIVKKEGQLAAVRTYIRENGPRAARRRANRQFFTRARQIDFRGGRYWAYGNEALLELPAIVAIKGHRRPMGGREATLQDPGGRETALQDPGGF